MTQAPSQQPVVPDGYELTKKKKPIYKRVWFIVLAVIVVIAIAKSASGGGGSTAASSSPAAASTPSTPSAAKAPAAAPKAAAGIGTAVRDGKFEFTVKNVDCSKSEIGTGGFTQKAQGVYCIVSVHVSNIGNEAQMFDASSQKAFDAQKREFSADSSAAMYLGDSGKSFLEQLNPGSAVDGQLVYDVPAGTKLTQIELHDSAFSGGVKVNLG
jgi:hypothetical protein